ncbi:LacI family transcriptional regulator [Alteromonas sp. I10]|uniref:LacI family DNA-binding transcriptional regulator n=1 Tax=Alteromonas TaxID=226 RepID=UPI000286F888|nr:MULTISPECIES: LacI family DNA-binding transcriptional regulator [Alteromonas]AFT96344.1 LacI family transcriptional regulator [Alteromonas macleodii str. 'Balearic Sea AD45']PXW75684.1 LacI family transcriptional regulator [Alteromonas sp. I10]
MAATIKSVAEMAGVSIKTVSRVINKEGTVKPDTLQRVEEAIKALKYTPNKAARDLASKGASVLGYVYDNPNAYYIIDMQKGILDVCRKNNFELLIHPCDASSKNIAKELVDMVDTAQLAGLILSPPLSEMPEVLSELDQNQISYVRILSGDGLFPSPLPYVLVNDFKAAYDITEHLISQGHKNIAFIAGEEIHKSTIERLNGYKAALEKAGIAIDESLIIKGTYSFETGVKSSETLLAMSPHPTAVFACNDEIAAGTLFGARMKGVDVPQELAIAGFENSPFSRQTFPPLTTASQPTNEIAQHAAASLIQYLRAKKAKAAHDNLNHTFIPELVVRASTEKQ